MVVKPVARHGVARFAAHRAALQQDAPKITERLQQSLYPDCISVRLLVFYSIELVWKLSHDSTNSHFYAVLCIFFSDDQLPAMVRTWRWHHRHPGVTIQWLVVLAIVSACLFQCNQRHREFSDRNGANRHL